MLKTALKRYFLTGLLVVTPIWGTVLILKTLFVTVEGILGDILAQLVPRTSGRRWSKSSHIITI